MAGVNLKQNPEGHLTLPGATEGESGAVFQATGEYIATSVDKTIFIAQRKVRVVRIVGRPTVAGTDGSAVTAEVRKVASGTAITSGTLLHSGTYDLKGTVNTNQVLTLSTTSADLNLDAGDSIAIDFTGTLTAATGVISVGLCPR